MDKKMQFFESKQFGQLRAVEIDGNPWFIGKDVAIALGYKNTKDALIRHVDDEDRYVGDGVEILDPIGRVQHPVAINESGLYSLILSSGLSSAKQFKRWVTNEVLPSIRKHGAYMSDDLLRQAAINSDVAAQVTKALIEEKSRSKALSDQLTQTQDSLHLVQKKAKELQSKAVYYNALVDASHCTGIRQTANELGKSQSVFTSFLLMKKYIYRDQKGAIQPYATAVRDGLLIVRDFVAVNGHCGTQTLVTPKGKLVFLSELQEMAG